MPGDKEEQPPILRIGDTTQELGEHLPLQEMARLARTSQSNRQFFQPMIDAAKAVLPLLTAVVQGNPEALAALVDKNPELLFQKGQVSLNKEYSLCLGSLHVITIKPNHLYLQTQSDGSLHYTVRIRPQEAPITATISVEELDTMGIGALPHPLTAEYIETSIKPQFASILAITKERGHTPAEMTFYDVSPYQLMMFLCDEEMLVLIMPHIPHEVTVTRPGGTKHITNSVELCKVQCAQINSGGGDLVKMDQDPCFLSFDELTRFTTSYDIYGLPTELTFPLLENPDGIIYYQEPGTGKEHLFYANKQTQKIEPIEPKAHSQKEQVALDELYASFRQMENNSARRSANGEHRLIAATMHHSLQRTGVKFDQCGLPYCDKGFDFNQYYNAYRQCIRLYQAQQWGEGDNAWRTLVGQVQLKVMWLLQRLCEKGRPFHPLPNFKDSPFKRGFEVYNVDKSIIILGFLTSCRLINGCFTSSCGSDFALCKGMEGFVRLNRHGRGILQGDPSAAGLDLVAVSRLIESAKANVVELTQALDSHNTATPSDHTPGC